MPPPPPDSWPAIRRKLRTWDHPRLLGLLHDLFTTVPEARAAIAGRLTLDHPAAAKASTLNPLRKSIRRAVRPTPPTRPMATRSPDMPSARRVADQYLRATSDTDGAIALYVELVEAAMELSFDLAWDDAPFLYDSIARDATAAETHLPHATDPALLTTLATRTRTLLSHRNFPGYGMDEVIDSLAEALAQQAQSLSTTQ